MQPPRSGSPAIVHVVNREHEQPRELPDTALFETSPPPLTDPFGVDIMETVSLTIYTLPLDPSSGLFFSLSTSQLKSIDTDRPVA